MASRGQNELRFRRWSELPDGGRRYWLDVRGRVRGFARYVKEVDENEATLRFSQEIFDDDGKLMEIHVKFPVDEGHRKV